ncbi:Arf-GAP with SH3 domain, ANK repeat and PH domain-containing protein [Paragonimus westermani]|uniref:Arf-GAP with SH3 domain, ANK repeat and PH domain-containing protein n=1 Tax=Paragonimus westermani TaxID=34504 RepID=A0A5J4NFY1_9TREM|nr:Arf-GAP with SH3 domain, ANK repeat and PH domain-containing protein [Paragonimus westermani]
MDHFGKSMSDLASRVSLLQNVHDAQKRRLVDTREEVRTLLEKDSSIANRKSRLFGQSSQAGVTYAAQPTQTNRAYGTRKNGFLLKRSDGKVKRVWQRRRVRIGDGELWLYHADESKQPVRLTLLTCQVKLPADIASQSQPEGGEIAAFSTSTHSATDLRNHFDLVSNSRTYNFQAENDHEFDEWISVLNNAMQEEFHRALNVDESANFDGGTSVNRNNSSTDATHDWNATHISSHAKYPFAIFSRTGSAGGGSLGDSLLGSENDLLDSSSPASRSRGSRISRVGSADALSNDLAVPVSTHGTPSSFLTKTGKALRANIQSSLRWCCPGNDVCADCDRADPEWVSVNLGVLICLECCGAHRELGVHCSRTQSLLMDDLSTNQLLLPRFIGNRLFNEVFESSLVNGIKPKPLDNTTDGSGMFQRRTFVKAKYVDRRYVTSTTSAFDTQASDASLDKRIRDPLSERFLRRDLLRSIVTNDLLTLIQVYAENFDLMTPFDLDDDDGASLGGVPNMTALHVAVQRAQLCAQKANGDCDSHNTSPLVLIEFILQNSPFVNVQRTNGRGDTALHHAIRCGSVDALKLLIQAGGIPTPMLRSTNKDGLTALQLGEQLLNQSECTTITSSVSKVAYAGCVELLRLAENSMSASTSADQSDSIFSSSDGSEHGLIAKAVLLDVVDQLNSVDWSFQNSRQTGTKQRASCRQAVSVSHASSALESCASLIWQSNFDGSGFQFSQSIQPSYRTSITTHGKLFPPKSIYLERVKHSHQAPTSSASTLSASRSEALTMHSILAQSKIVDTKSDASPSSDLTKLAEIMHSSLCQDSTLDSQLQAHSSMSELCTDSQPADVSENLLSQPGSKLCISTEHIDILLDVLEEKPSPTSACSPVSGASSDPPPPVPPKPHIPSSVLYSNLHSKASVNLHPPQNLATDLGRLRSNADSKSIKSVLPTTPRLPKPCLFPDKSITPPDTSGDQTGELSCSSASCTNSSQTVTQSSVADCKLGALLEAIYDCDAEHSDELSFRQGEVIELVARSDDDWWVCETTDFATFCYLYALVPFAGAYIIS